MDIYKTDLNLLRVFDALMRTKNVTRAGDLLDLSQPSVSFALNKLRTLCGDDLFVRTPGGVQPTPRALKMAKPVRQALELIQRDVFQTDEFVPASSEREFRIGLSDIGEMTFLPKILKRLQEQAPGITVRTANLPLEALEQEMIAGDIDLVIGFYPNFSKGNFYQQHLYREDFVCMMRSGRPRVRQEFEMKEFCEALHLVPAPGNRGQDLFEDYLRSIGITRKVAFATPHYLCIPYVVLSSDMIATVPRECIAPFSLFPGLQFVEAPFKSPVFDVKQHWHAMYHGDPANRWLRALVYASFAASGPEPMSGTA
jgi:DNA-binding transcriptional LysR family regulator